MANISSGILGQALYPVHKNQIKRYMWGFKSLFHIAFFLWLFAWLFHKDNIFKTLQVKWLVITGDCGSCINSHSKCPCLWPKLKSTWKGDFTEHPTYFSCGPELQCNCEVDHPPSMVQTEHTRKYCPSRICYASWMCPYVFLPPFPLLNYDLPLSMLSRIHLTCLEVLSQSYMYRFSR